MQKFGQKMANNVLTQMGNALVRECVFQGKPAVEKRNASEVELDFYQYHASVFRAEGPGIPDVYSLNRQTRRLIIEFIPQPCSLETLTASPDLYEKLASLHHCQMKPSGIFRRHQWRDDQMELALSLLKFPPELEAMLHHFKAHSDVLFEPQQWVSGDSNAGNWGRRAGGELVLFDWERFGRGSPAIDLAPLIKGMGEPASIHLMVARYQQVAPQWSGSHLTRHVLLAKAWLVVEVLNILSQRHPQMLTRYLDWYQVNLPAWLPQAQHLWRSTFA